MQEKFTAYLPPAFIMPGDNEQLLAAIDALFAIGTQTFAEIVEALKQEEKEKFGSPEITNLRFEVKRYNPVTLAGRLRINYDLQLTFSCSALVNDLNNQHSYWDFFIDPETRQIHFEGEPYGDLRSTAGEL
ncbi:hypothetical protein [Mucilaginibacter sp.]|uniref:hypothetical protein n=1 Tax=Mucilaginibacter sp. TaxID=1882438 RepID=UPI0035BC204A